MVLLRLFGGASLESGEKPITGRSAQRRRIALLALLALARRGLTRDKLIGYLWAESDMEKARRLLSESLYVLRREMGEDAITVAGDELRLNPAVIECDVVAFEEAIERADLEKAAALYAGPFLDGFHVSDALELDRWIDTERDRLARAYGLVLEKLAEAATAERRLDDAVGWWRRMAELDPFSGRFAVGLMQALEAAGNRAAALTHANIHRTLLREELDAEPDPAVAALAERLRDAPDPTWTAPPSVPRPASPGTTVSPAPTVLPVQSESSGDTVESTVPVARRPVDTGPVPAGSTVTFLFSDIEGSTALLRRLGPKYGDLLSTHHAIIRECLARCNGREIDTAGDGFFIAFPRARDAVTAAITIRRRFAETGWPDGVTVRVRMGLHTGEPAPTSTGFVGLDVHRAARIAGLARGGQILLSSATRELIAGDVPGGATVRDHGTHTLKDIDEPEHLWEIEPDAVTHPTGSREGAAGPSVSTLLAKPVPAGSLAAPAVAPATRGVVASSAATASRPRFVRRRNLLVAAALIGLAVAAFTLTASWRNGVPSVGNANAIDTGVRVVVVPFQCPDCRPEVSRLRRGLAHLITLRLEGVRQIRTTPTSQVVTEFKLVERSDARRIARRFDATHVVSGVITETGAMLTVTAELIAVGGADTDTTKIPMTGSLERADSIADALALELIEALIPGPGRQLAMEGLRALASLEVLPAWELGEHEFMAARYPQAVEAFEDAVRADSTFAHGHHRLSMASEWNLQFEQAHVAADLALRHSAGLSERQRAPIQAWHALLNGEVETARNGYERILQYQPDQVEAWYGLGEVYAHFSTPRGEPVGPAREMFTRVIELVTPTDPVPGAARPGYGDAHYHLLELAAADRDAAAYDSLIAAVDTSSYQRLAFEAVRAFGWRDQAEQAAMERRLAAQREPLKIATAAVRIAAHLHDFESARRIARIVAERPGLSHEWQAGARLLMAEFSFAGGRLSDAFEDVDAAATLEPQWPHEIRAFFALARFVDLPREELVRIRDDVEAWNARADQPSTEFFFGVHGWVHRYIRLYLLGMLDLRLGDLTRAESSQRELRLPTGPNGEALRSALALSLSAHLDLARGSTDTAGALTRLRNITIPAWIEQVGFSPFYSRAYDRLVMAELNRENGDMEEALRWYTSLTEGYEILFAGPAHYRIAEILDQLGQPDSAEAHRQEFRRLWPTADSLALAGLSAGRW